MTTMTTDTPSTPVLLDDLLLDAAAELEAAELPELGQAVARARVELVRRCIVEHEPPIEMAGPPPDTIAPSPSDAPVSMLFAERVAERFHARYEELAPSFGYETRVESRKPWVEVPNRELMIATAAAVLGEVLSPATLQTLV